MHFIKNNLKLFLRLVSTDIHNTEVCLTANEFNSLRVIFKPQPIQGTALSRSLASLTPFYSVGSHSTKIHMTELSDWLIQNVEQEDVLGHSYRKLGPDALKPQSDHITFLNKCVTIKDKANLQDNIDVKILNCEESYIYINQAIDCLFVSDCVNCTIFAAAVRRVCTMTNCESVNLTVAASAVRVGNSVDCTLFCYSHLGAPVIYGDTRNL